MRIILSTILLLSSLIIFSCNNKDVILFDFESGTLDNWTVFGQNPFYGGKPVSSDTIKTWKWDATGYTGKYMLASGGHEGRHNNHPDGGVKSIPFKINRQFLNFYLAGELNPRVRIYLEINGEIVRQAFGNNFYDLQLRGWDLSEFRGQKAQIVIEDIHSRRSLLRVDHFYLSNTPPPSPEEWAIIPQRQLSGLVSVGEFRLLLNSNRVNKNWQIFHSSIVFGNDKKWHLFASAADISAEGKSSDKKYIVHAESKILTSENWDFTGIVFSADKKYNEDFILHPFVLYENGTFYMYYVGSGKTWSGWTDCPGGKKMPWDWGKCGDQGPYNIHLATSKDGSTWKRYGKIITDSPFAFTPYVHQINEEWVMYYAAAEPAGITGKHAIVYSKSKDLYHWNGRGIALIDRENGASPWPEHSFILNPHVFSRGNTWYMLAGPIDNNNLSPFNCLRVFNGSDSFKWDISESHKSIFADGGSVFRNTDGSWYITHNNAMSGGTWIAPLYWNDGPDNKSSLLKPSGQ
ncbi:hypothetical protein JXQ31_05255 [candidate division KSB1 bacterium]|nr:hypothetical protein [candidate division KSB1 bacterium]